MEDEQANHKKCKHVKEFLFYLKGTGELLGAFNL